MSASMGSCVAGAGPVTLAEELYNFLFGDAEKRLATGAATLNYLARFQGLAVSHIPPSLPLPVSCRPQVACMKTQETPADICRVWPTDLTLLGLAESDRMCIDAHLRDAFRSRNITKLTERSLVYKTAQCCIGIEFPYSITIRKIAERLQITLFPRTVFIQSGERRIKWAFDLTEGEWRLKKRLVGRYESKILRHLIDRRIERGFKPTGSWLRQTKDSKGVCKLQIIEPLREGVTSILFGTEPFRKFATKERVILDLLEDLQDLHKLVLIAHKKIVKDSDPAIPVVEVDLPEYKAFHADIKIANTLVFQEDGVWRAELCDFGKGAADLDVLSLSVGYTAPEYIHLYKILRPEGFYAPTFTREVKVAVMEFNITHGRHRDIWSMGLVLLSVLIGRMQKIAYLVEGVKALKTIPPLECLKGCIESDEIRIYTEEKVTELTQETVDRDIDRLEEEVRLKHRGDELNVGLHFKAVRGMLRINPDERITAAAALHTLTAEDVSIA